MEIKDVVKGKRVKVIADSVNLIPIGATSDNLIPIGATGILIESNTFAPYVDFDEHHEGCFELDDYKNVRVLYHYELEEIE